MWLPMVYRRAAFIRFWGMDTYVSDLWGTSDGVIPYPAFCELEEEAERLRASERVESALAAALAALIQNVGGPRAQAEIDKLVKKAYPEIPL